MEKKIDTIHQLSASDQSNMLDSDDQMRTTKRRCIKVPGGPSLDSKNDPLVLSDTMSVPKPAVASTVVTQAIPLSNTTVVSDTTPGAASSPNENKTPVDTTPQTTVEDEIRAADNRLATTQEEKARVARYQTPYEIHADFTSEMAKILNWDKTRHAENFAAIIKPSTLIGLIVDKHMQGLEMYLAQISPVYVEGLLYACSMDAMGDMITEEKFKELEAKAKAETEQEVKRECIVMYTHVFAWQRRMKALASRLGVETQTFYEDMRNQFHVRFPNSEMT